MVVAVVVVVVVMAVVLAAVLAAVLAVEPENEGSAERPVLGVAEESEHTVSPISPARRSKGPESRRLGLPETFQRFRLAADWLTSAE